MGRPPEPTIDAIGVLTVTVGALGMTFGATGLTHGALAFGPSRLTPNAWRRGTDGGTATLDPRSAALRPAQALGPERPAAGRSGHTGRLATGRKKGVAWRGEVVAATNVPVKLRVTQI